tara:strand:+ start:1715 stop:1948 length:234 start_codon:yes stop_codon:yes gene_type:complete
MDWQAFLNNILILFGYGISAALMLSLALGILIKIWDKISPINEWEELKKGNVAVAIVTSAVFLSLAIVVAAAIIPGN